MITLELKYSLGIKQHKASYGRPSQMSYIDSNYAGNTKSRQSIIGYIYYLNRAAVSWSSKRAKAIIVSLTQAKYVALSNVLK